MNTCVVVTQMCTRQTPMRRVHTEKSVLYLALRLAGSIVGSSSSPWLCRNRLSLVPHKVFIRIVVGVLALLGQQQPTAAAATQAAAAAGHETAGDEATLQGDCVTANTTFQAV